MNSTEERFPSRLPFLSQGSTHVVKGGNGRSVDKATAMFLVGVPVEDGTSFVRPNLILRGAPKVRLYSLQGG